MKVAIQRKRAAAAPRDPSAVLQRIPAREASPAEYDGDSQGDGGDLDFTMKIMRPRDNAKLMAEAGQHLTEAIKLLEGVIASAEGEEKDWRLLAVLYLAVQRTDSLEKLEGRHEQCFGRGIVIEVPTRKPTPPSGRRVFAIPEKITPGSLPDINAVCAACAEPQGALLDFSRVNSVGTGGLRELMEFFSMLPSDDTQPEMPGTERFMGGLEKILDSGRSSKDLWSLLFSYWRLRDDQEAFEELAIKYAVITGISPPSW